MEALAIMFAVVGLVWGATVFLRGGLLGGCLAVMLAGACFSVPFFKLPLGLLPLTVDRILLVLLIVQYVVWRRWGLAEPKPLGKAELVACGLTAVIALSTFSADWRVFNCQPVSWLIIFYLMPLSIYWIARQATLSERGVLALFACLTAFGCYLAVTALAEFYQAWWLVFPKYIVTTAAESKLEFIGRGRGPLLNPIGNGMLLAICLSGALMWWPRLSRMGKACGLPLVLLFSAAIYCTMTRSTWIGGLLSVGIIAAAALPRHWRLPALGGGLLIAILVTATQWEHIVSFKRDRNLDADKTAESVHLRPVLAVIGWHMFLDRPLLGCGYAQYKTEHLNYLADRSTDLPLEKGRGYIAHNVIFSLLAETGLVGAGLFIILLVLWARDAWRLWRQRSAPLWARQQGLLFLCVLAAYITNGLFHDVSCIAMANMTLFFLAGVTAGMRPLLKPAAEKAVAGARGGLARPAVAAL